MKKSLKIKLLKLKERFDEITKELSLPETIKDQNLYRDLNKESSQLEPIVTCFQVYQQNEQAIENAKELLNENDKILQELAQEEIKTLEESQQTQLEMLINIVSVTACKIMYIICMDMLSFELKN